MNKFNTIIMKKMAEQGLTKNKLSIITNVGTTMLTRFSRGLGVSSKTLEKLLDALCPGWEKKID